MFDDFSDAYEAMIDWPKRLANEEGLYRWLFARVGARSVLDAACGTGQHAALFHSWGLRVEGADLSGAMIEQCRQRYGEPAGLRWVQRGFDVAVDASASFDAAICVGNSLALAPDRATAARAVAQLLAGVRAGGAIMAHVVNLWAIPPGPVKWQKCKRAALNGVESLIIKGIHREGSAGYVEMLVAPLAAASPSLRSESARFLGLEADDLATMARDSGATWVEVYGNHQRQPYRRESSQDLILVAGK